ncbi:otoferlin-like [Vicugna pacos]|uniref:Otoferlin-like n=1 Tax=Vicugna pacos TaxID=30538 RepID=A0ABM5DKY9_VICPA
MKLGKNRPHKEEPQREGIEMNQQCWRGRTLTAWPCVLGMGQILTVSLASVTALTNNVSNSNPSQTLRWSQVLGSPRITS